MEITLDIDKFAKDVVDKALNDIKLEGKTIREWVEIIAKQQTSDVCIRREEAIKTVLPYADGDLIADDLMRLPPVKPESFINKPCISEGVCHEDKLQMLDKIRAEIEQIADEEQKYDKLWATGLRYAIKIIDKYRTKESEE